jgi:hypothetical protein
LIEVVQEEPIEEAKEAESSHDDSLPPLVPNEQVLVVD